MEQFDLCSAEGCFAGGLLAGDEVDPKQLSIRDFRFRPSGWKVGGGVRGAFVDRNLHKRVTVALHADLEKGARGEQRHLAAEGRLAARGHGTPGLPVGQPEDGARRIAADQVSRLGGRRFQLVDPAVRGVNEIQVGLTARISSQFLSRAERITAV
ncbi:MAG: hypothetical protein E6J00_03220 [Chloroflexi bacterium]|nr:MAG: hypothetical protein E6J00_03220 [Chloroflexota bacterium]